MLIDTYCITALSLCSVFSEPLQPLEGQASATIMNSSARLMVLAYQASGSVTAIRTVRMDPMSTTPALLSPAGPTTSSVPTKFAFRQVGCAMVTTTAGT